MKHVGLRVVVGAPSPEILEAFAAFDVERANAGTLATLVNALWRRERSSVLAVWDAVVVPPEFLDPALAIVAADPRVCSVSFFSNASGYLSFPDRNGPRDRPPDGQDEVSVTRKLRTLSPPPAPAPIPVAMGHAVLLSGAALSAAGPLRELPGSANDAVADFCLAARRRGFMDVLDPGTFYARPSDIAVEPMRAFVEAEYELPHAIARHPFIIGLIQRERGAASSPFGLAFATARAKAVGVRVLLDGSCLGPQEMGTQVTVLALVRALCARADVSEVGVALAAPVPPYAVETLSLPKVRSFRRAEEMEAWHADIGHRPMQPDSAFDLPAWRRRVDRVLVSILDLIAYQIGSYHPTGEEWLRYREAIWRSAGSVDGVAVISEDVGVQVGIEQLPIDPSRLVVAPYGSDHLTGGERHTVPAELLARGFLAGQFLLALGATYTHKNRDLAVRALGCLRARGHKLSLVLVGAAVPYGSSRTFEDAAAGWDDDATVFVLPDVTSEERNWLLHHASAVLYPTSAEGFGLVPFEAARFGTPTVFVPFGPLAETSGGLPGLPRDWDPEELAASVERLLADPAAAEAQVSATLAAGRSYTWARTADLLVSAYRRLIALPPRLGVCAGEPGKE